MLREALQFVQGAVSTKDMIPVLTHYHIYGDRIQGTNGRITIDAGIKIPGIGQGVTVPADLFLRAVDACAGNPDLSITDGGKLVIKKKGFRALLALADHSSFPRKELAGEEVEFSGKLLPMLRRLRPFVSDDASRPWSMGILLTGEWAYATNNVIAVRSRFDGVMRSPLALPVAAVDELLRINREPDRILQSDTAVSFIFGGDWLQSLSLSAAWPDIAAHFIDLDVGIPVPDTLLDDVAKVTPFCANQKFPVINFSAEGISTEEGTHMAVIAGEELPPGRYRTEVLTAVLEVANTVNFAAYPKPVGFAGDGIEGVFVGVRA